MNKLYKPKKNYLDSDVLCPIKMKKVREILTHNMKAPKYEDWKMDDEGALMKDLAFRTLPVEYEDVQKMARYLYTNYIIWSFKKVDGIDEWKKEFDDYFTEEMIE